MYAPQPQLSPPSSPASVHAPVPRRSYASAQQQLPAPGQHQQPSGSLRWPSLPGRDRSTSASSADSTGALVGLGFDHDGPAAAPSTSGSRRAAGAGDDMVEVLLPNTPPPAGSQYARYGYAADLPSPSLASHDLDPTPTPVSYAFSSNPSQHPSYAHLSPSGALSSSSVASTSSFAGLLPSPQQRSYAPSLASSIGGRSLFDREGGWAPALSRTASLAGSVTSSSFAGSELAEKFDFTNWDPPAAGEAGHGDSAPEPDDWLHNEDKGKPAHGSIWTLRGLQNLGCLTVLALALFMLFAGYPIISEVQKHQPKTMGAFNLGGVNASGQVPEIVGNFGLIDADTPKDAYSIVADSGDTWELVFSDEFEQDGRSFYPGDDPYWEATDLHSWGTNDLEWYSPQQTTTQGGYLVQTLDRRPIHDLDYAGASLQSWNKFCFQGGRLEAKIRLPGSPNVMGLWPAFWTMGNLGRVGYGGTLEGLWPYSYDACDVGTLANQTLNGLPTAATTTGAQGDPGNGALSFLPGQRLSRCTCPSDETHPGPKHSDGSWKGRSAPEIDIIEAQVADGQGEGSFSAQWAPFDDHYIWQNETYGEFVDPDVTKLNTYADKQTTSGVSITNQECYQYPASGGEGCFAVYAFEYEMGDNGYIKWFNDDKLAWTYKEGGMGPNARVNISNRPIPYEPMYILFNLAISENFGWIDFDNLDPLWPMHMMIDYVRVYQPADNIRIGCDPDDAPTAKYIARYNEAYHNPNITTWDSMTDNAPKPKNRLIDTC